MKKHINIPIFIPHEGCPHSCVFCDQREITGETLRADRDIVPEIEQALQTVHSHADDTQIAFFGGSFTGLDPSLMRRLLRDAHSFVDGGRVSSIRLSTRPDYISDGILDLLAEYAVTDIELGVQSMSQRVLDACGRGHTVKDTAAACERIAARGFSLTGQMMVGLPLSSPADETDTARSITALGARSARIYPTVVFRGTKLYRMAKAGEYAPLTTDDAVNRCAAAYRVFLEGGVTVLRVGLQWSERLSDPRKGCAGACHESLGELVAAKLYFSRIAEFVNACDITRRGVYSLTLFCAAGEASKVAGHRRANKERIRALFENRGAVLRHVKIIQTDLLPPFETEAKLVQL